MGGLLLRSHALLELMALERPDEADQGNEGTKIYEVGRFAMGAGCLGRCRKPIHARAAR